MAHSIHASKEHSTTSQVLVFVSPDSALPGEFDDFLRSIKFDSNTIFHDDFLMLIKFDSNTIFLDNFLRLIKFDSNK